jgi:hypothetical protein
MIKHSIEINRPAEEVSPTSIRLTDTTSGRARS